MRGFEFAETMAGSYHLLSAPAEERPIAFSVRARSSSLRRFLKDREVEIEGAIDAEGLADHRPLRGTMGLDVLRTGILSYSFRFRGNDDLEYAFIGQKDVDIRRLAETMTVLPGKLMRGSDAIAEALLRFDLRSDLVRFLKSFRLLR